MTTDLDLRRAFIGMLAAEMDNDSTRVAMLLHRDDDPEFAAKVAAYAARVMVAALRRKDEEEQTEIRGTWVNEMFELATLTEGQV